jgi:sterol desaturase/sphingolipid hydroxylase (fatty acid hydroxylase superfamily)
MSLLQFFGPALAAMTILTLMESRLGRRSGEAVRNLAAWGLSLAVAFTVLPLVQVWHGAALIDARDLPFWLGFAIFLVLRDAGEFAYHVAQHKIPALWRMHALHHSDPDMCALTTNRHFWGDQLIKQMTVWTMPAMIITPTAEIFALYALVSTYHYFAHANLRIGFGRWSWILNSPAYHRRHHSCLPEHYDSNFAALFPIFDVMIGTYHRPDGWPPSGLESRPESLLDLAAWPLRMERDSAPSAEAAA